MNEVRETCKQFLVLNLLREKVTEVAHDLLFRGQLEVRKTKNRI